jgi:DNA-binding NtrC family response regulator
MVRVIVADDDPTARKVLTRMLSPEYQVTSFANGQEALNYFSAKGADIILTDMKMPKMDGLELLTKVKAIAPETIVFMITGFSTVNSAVAALKNGAYDYIPKPFAPNDVLIRIKRALKEKTLEEDASHYQQERRLAIDKYDFVTKHPKVLEIIEMVKKVALTDSTVLIQGETGVGKELIARMIHKWSPRRDHAFVPINCSALSTGVMESELFGHEKGAFTGAVDKRMGFFELADKGTILLDEIGTTDQQFQVKLLRVLQDKFIYRVGSPTAKYIDARIIASTNQDLQQEAMANLFRSDLYYRLSVVTINMPPLRERGNDITLLANFFVKKHKHINPRVEAISSAGLMTLMNYNYPGNVRELENIIERAMILENTSQLTPASLLMNSISSPSNKLVSQASPLVQPEESKDEAKFHLKSAEKEYIINILRLCEGKKIATARMLGINKTTLWRKMKKYGLESK